MCLFFFFCLGFVCFCLFAFVFLSNKFLNAPKALTWSAVMNKSCQLFVNRFKKWFSLFMKIGLMNHFYYLLKKGLQYLKKVYSFSQSNVNFGRLQNPHCKFKYCDITALASSNVCVDNSSVSESSIKFQSETSECQSLKKIVGIN